MQWYRGSYLLFETLNIKEKSSWLTLNRKTLNENFNEDEIVESKNDL